MYFSKKERFLLKKKKKKLKTEYGRKNIRKIKRKVFNQKIKRFRWNRLFRIDQNAQTLLSYSFSETFWLKEDYIKFIEDVHSITNFEVALDDISPANNPETHEKDKELIRRKLTKYQELGVQVENIYHGVDFDSNELSEGARYRNRINENIYRSKSKKMLAGIKKHKNAKTFFQFFYYETELSESSYDSMKKYLAKVEENKSLWGKSKKINLLLLFNKK